MKCLVCGKEGWFREGIRCKDIFCGSHYQAIVHAEQRMEEQLTRFKNMNTQAIIQEYVEQKDLIREAEKRVKELQFQIKQFAEVDDVFDLENATVSMVKGRASYKYSEGLTMTEQELKEAKKLEEQTGVAEVIEGEPYLIVKFK